MSFIFCRQHGSTVGVRCDTVNITRVDRVDRSPPNRHQHHVRKLRPSITLVKIRRLRCYRDFGNRGQHVDASRWFDLHQTGEKRGRRGSWLAIVGDTWTHDELSIFIKRL